MSLEMSQVTAAGRPIIQAYGGGGFKIDGAAFDGSVLVLPTAAQAWSVGAPEGITMEALAPILGVSSDVDILIVGCGARFTGPPKGLRQALKDAGLSLEWMDTGAACRTFNILLTEERRVSAAILAVD